MTELQGKTIVITGAASGLGRAWTEGFLKDGATVIAADVNEEGLNEVEVLGALTIQTDVSVEQQVKAMVDFAVVETGRIDVLFNNAGMGESRTLLDIKEGQFEYLTAVHLFGTIYGMRYALPYMQSAGTGRIVNTISRAGEVCAAKSSSYAAAKAAIWAATRSVQQEHKDEDILINMLIPGPTNTAIWGRDMPQMQTAEVTYSTAKMLATLPMTGPRGEVFWNEKQYPMFASVNKK
jgi:NAD(P)-dependent dehydrogenase (short-subunit alcohol dehydrogenase family)